MFEVLELKRRLLQAGGKGPSSHSIWVRSFWVRLYLVRWSGHQSVHWSSVHFGSVHFGSFSFWSVGPFIGPLVWSIHWSTRWFRLPQLKRGACLTVVIDVNVLFTGSHIG